VLYSDPVTVTTPSEPAGTGVPPTPTLGTPTQDTSDPTLIDVPVSDLGGNIAYFTGGTYLASDPYHDENVDGFDWVSPDANGNATIKLERSGEQGTGILSVIAHSSAGVASAPGTETIDLNTSPDALPAVSPVLTVTPASNGQLTVSWTGALTESDSAGTDAWNDTEIMFGAPDGHSPDSALDAGGDGVSALTVNPDGTGSAVIDPVHPLANGVGDYVYIQTSGGYVSNMVQISPEASPPEDNPHDVTATPFIDSTGSGFRILWDDNSNNETGFTIQRSTSQDFSTDLQTFTVGADVTSFTDAVNTSANSIQPGVQYYYQVKATNDAGSSWYLAANSGSPVTLTLPTVSISAIDPNAEADPQDAWFDITRNSDFDDTLAVNLALSGTEPTGDYTLADDAGNAIGNTVEFQPGVHSIVVTVVPTDETTETASDETVVADIAPSTSNPTYLV
jgi:hypothetical protein